MRTLMPAFVAVAMLAGIAAPAIATVPAPDAAGSHCPAGYSNVWGACVTG